MGSGLSQPDNLLEVDLDILDNKQCEEAYEAAGIDIGANMICASGEGKDSCQGDSGGEWLRQG